MSDRIVSLLVMSVLGLVLGACVFDADSDLKATLLAPDDESPMRTFFIGGSVEGATGVLTLQNSNGRTLTLARDGSFAFETQMVSSAIYNVTVAVHPESQTCRVAHGSGTVKGADVRNVVVTCTPHTHLSGVTRIAKR
jgi:hypothetical protein